MLCTEMEPTDAEKRKALRIQLLLIWLMAAMIAVPFLIYFLHRS